MGGTWAYLDITALGRQEEWEDSPEGYPQTPTYQWWRRHDEYDGSARPPPSTPSRSSAARGARLEELGLMIALTWEACRWRRSLPSVTGAGAGLLARARLAAAAPATPAGAREMTDDKTLRIERTFRAPAEAVFEAWTSEEVLRRWWHAEHGWETTEAEVDLRVGGTVRVVMRDPDKDVEYGGGGTYTEVEPPTRLAFTWTWDDDPRQTLIEVDFEESDGVDHRPLHPQPPLGRGGRALARGRVEQALRQPRTPAGDRPSSDVSLLAAAAQEATEPAMAEGKRRNRRSERDQRERQRRDHPQPGVTRLGIGEIQYRNRCESEAE